MIVVVVEDVHIVEEEILVRYVRVVKYVDIIEEKILVNIVVVVHYVNQKIVQLEVFLNIIIIV